MDWKTIDNDKEKYAAYLCSREWAEKREQVRERAYNKCERCFVAPMEACHHLTYERKYNERLEDLQAICNDCHEFTHGKVEFDPCLRTYDLDFTLDGFVQCLRCGRHNKTTVEQMQTIPAREHTVNAFVLTLLCECGVASNTTIGFDDGRVFFRTEVKKRVYA